MFFKLALLIVTVAAASAAQLSIRHQRLQAVHDMTIAINEGAALERRVQSLRVRVAHAVIPERIYAQATAMWDLKPILTDWAVTPTPLAALSDAPLSQDPYTADIVGPFQFTDWVQTPTLASTTSIDAALKNATPEPSPNDAE